MDVKDHVEVISTTITIEADLAILGLSDPSSVSYRKQVYTLSRPANWDAIGPEVRHIYEVRNVGVVRMPPSTLSVHWPLQLLNENNEFEFVLYLVKEPEIDIEFTAACTYDRSIVNPLRIPEKTGVPLSDASAADAASGDETNVEWSSQPARYQRASATTNKILDCDGGELECRTVTCNIAELSPGDSAVITFYARLWNRTISRNYAGETELEVKSTGRLSVGVQQTSVDNDLLQVSTGVVLRADDVESSVRWWIILLAVLAGHVLLVLLILLMWKLGFFKRKRLSEYQAARMSSRQQAKVTQEQPEQQLVCKSP